MMEALPECSLTVLSSIDNKHYKMVMKGDIGLLTVQKIKRYLHHATGLDPQDQRLTYENRLLLDHEKGSDFHLEDGAVIQLTTFPVSRAAASSSLSSGGGASSTKPQSHVAAAPNVSPKQIAATSTASHSLSLLPAASPAPHTTSRTPTVAESSVAESWHSREMQRVREEERHRYEAEKRLRDEEAMQREVERARIQERNRLLEEDLKETEHRMRLEVETLRAALLREQKAGQEARDKLHRLESERVCEQEELKEERRRWEAERQRLLEERRITDEEMEQLVVRQSREIDAVRAEKLAVEAKLVEANSRCTTASNVRDTLARSLQYLALELHVGGPLLLDENQTCILTVRDNVNLILTFDPSTDRLFMYTTVLNFLPDDATVRLQLYEELLQAALLGRDIAAGCVGISKSANQLVLLSISFDLRFSSDQALRCAAAPFISAAKRLAERAQQIVARGHQHTSTA